MIRTLKQLVKRHISAYTNELRIARILAAYPQMKIEANVFIKGNIGNLVVHGDAVIQSGSFIHLGGMDWCQWAGRLEMGDGTVISPGCVIYAAGPYGVKIGKNFDCGPGVGVFSSRTDYRTNAGGHIFQPVEIGDYVTVFANAVISPGVKIGNHAVIAAGAVVVDDVPENALVGGVPARVIRQGIKVTDVRDH